MDLDELRDWCEEIATAEWTRPSTAPPSWEEAEERRGGLARLHRVEHLSPSHQAWIISTD